jgi:hypothetical protein
MIISHKYQFIFIHCSKVAGSSIKVALAPYLGENDIVIGSLNEILDSGTSINKATKQTFMTPKSICWATVAKMIGKSNSESINIGVKAFYKDKLSKNPPHPTAQEISAYFPQEWNKYFKFAFVRNPYEQVVSDYLWRKRKTGKDISFINYLKLVKNNKTISSIISSSAYYSNWKMISINDQIVVDQIGRYENLEENFLEIINHIGINANIKLSKQKNNPHNPQKENYKRFYGKEEKKLVDQLFQKEIFQLGYNFPY